MTSQLRAMVKGSFSKHVLCYNFSICFFREERFYTLKPEEYVVKIEHSIIATKFFGSSKNDIVAGSQRSMKGWLYDVDGSQVRE